MEIPTTKTPWHVWVTASATLALVFVGTAQSVSSYYQYKTSKALADQDAIRTRAWVLVEKPSISLQKSGALVLSFQLQNSGQSIARNVRYYNVVNTTNNGDLNLTQDTDPDHFDTRNGSLAILPPTPGALAYIQLGSNSSGRATQQRLRTGTPYIYGTLKYSDTYGVQHQDDYCFIEDKQANVYYSCAVHNTAD